MYFPAGFFAASSPVVVPSVMLVLAVTCIFFISKKILTFDMTSEQIKFKTVRVSDKGQISIPSDIRKEMKIKKGEELLLVKKGDKLLVEKASQVSKRFAGEFDFMLKHAEAAAQKLWSNREDEIWDKL